MGFGGRGEDEVGADSSLLALARQPSTGARRSDISSAWAIRRRARSLAPISRVRSDGRLLSALAAPVAAGGVAGAAPPSAAPP